MTPPTETPAASSLPSPEPRNFDEVWRKELIELSERLEVKYQEWLRVMELHLPALKKLDEAGIYYEHSGSAPLLITLINAVKSYSQELLISGRQIPYPQVVALRAAAQLLENIVVKDVDITIADDEETRARVRLALSVSTPELGIYMDRDFVESMDEQEDTQFHTVGGLARFTIWFRTALKEEEVKLDVKSGREGYMLADSTHFPFYGEYEVTPGVVQDASVEADKLQEINSKDVDFVIKGLIDNGFLRDYQPVLKLKQLLLSPNSLATTAGVFKVEELGGYEYRRLPVIYELRRYLTLFQIKLSQDVKKNAALPEYIRFFRAQQVYLEQLAALDPQIRSQERQEDMHLNELIQYHTRIQGLVAVLMMEAGRA